MTARLDILDERERLSRPFWGSLALHLSLAAAILSYGHWNLGSKNPLLGDPHGGGFGSVVINPVANIPLPSKNGATNPVANDTESRVPTPPPKKEQAKKAEDLNAIPLPSRGAKKKQAERAQSQPNKWRDAQSYRDNQIFSSVGQAASSPTFSIAGGGGVGLGNNSVFGTAFGWYANALRDRVAQNWRTNDVNAQGASAPAATVIFTVRKDGSVAPGSVRISQPSGNRALDFSAQRAVYDAAPFGALPNGFPRSEATVELRFELRR
jgi:TonB family protein